jgi:hypothetical protein
MCQGKLFHTFTPIIFDFELKVWDLSQLNSSANTPNASAGHIPHKPTYTLHPSFPVRRVLWRPGYECEIAIVSNANAEFGSGNFSELAGPTPGPTYASALGIGSARTGSVSTPNLLASNVIGSSKDARERGGSGIGDAVEIWDARRGWIAKWTVRGSAIEGGVTGSFTLAFFSISADMFRYCIS